MNARVTERAERLAQRIAAPVTRFAIAALMLWFGLPKLLPAVSPAESLAVRTAEALTGGLVTGEAARLGIAGLEISLGVALVVGRAMPLVLLGLSTHVLGTSTPLVLFPDETWRSPMVATLEGQYIIKNVLIIAGMTTLVATDLRRRARPTTTTPTRDGRRDREQP